MAGYLPPRKRNMVPRWRSPAVTEHLGDLRSSQRTRPTNDVGSREFERALADWRVHRTASNAAEVVAGALVTDQGELALDAAHFLVDVEAPAAFALRTRTSRGLLGSSLTPEDPQQGSPRALIHDLRLKALAYPRSALGWIELALAYTNLGLAKRAERFIRMAINLAPDNRYVLRSAVRYYLHIGEGESAYHLLYRSPIVPRDPWLAAAELAVASIIARKPDTLKDARALLHSNDYSSHDTSELASQLATIALRDGQRLRAKRLFEEALRSPTDNSVAQVRWIADLDTSFSIPQGALSAPRNFEANALKHFHGGVWPKAAKDSWRWHHDEPFARRAAILGSYVSSEMLQNYEEACDFAAAGLASNPGDPSLLNNKAYSLAMLGKTREARECIEAFRPKEHEDFTLIPKLATSGLIYFREGQLAAGRKLYLEAIDKSRGPDLARVKMMAALHLAFEEVRVRSEDAEKWVKMALDETKASTLPDIRTLRERLRAAFAVIQTR
jgi:tetratricopeptide (TPR) repeat protein